MKLFVVIGIIDYEDHDILGIYDSHELAQKRYNNTDLLYYDRVSLIIYYLNKDVEPNEGSSDYDNV